jgi:flagellar biosynthetic protein FliR
MDAFFQQQIPAWTLIFFRFSGLMIFAPFFGSRNVPIQLKGLFAVLLTALVAPTVSTVGFVPPLHLVGFALAAASELAIGVLFGLLGSMLFVGIQLGGELIDHQMGFTLASVIDPLTDNEGSLIGQFFFFFSVLVFLMIQGHHALLRALQESFAVVPLGRFLPGPVAVGGLVQAFGEIFVLALRVAAPVMAALFLTTLVLGFIARTVPQVNVLIMGFPLQIGVGMITLVVTLPYAVWMVEEVTGQMIERMEGVLL